MNAESQKALKVIRVAANKTGREQNRIDTLGIRDIQYMTHLRPKLHTLGHHCLLVPMLVCILAPNQFLYLLV